MKRFGLGVVGSGDISRRYLTCLSPSAGIDMVACASRELSDARVLAAEFGIEACSLDALVERDDIDLVLNLTTPSAHFEVTRRALDHGKAVYTEKPLSPALVEAKALIELAEARGLMLASAPATMLGPAQQRLRAMIDRGEIGEVVGASTAIAYAGPDLFHPNADRLFAYAAGPLMDMGVYQVTALVALLGPVESVTATGRRMRSERTIQRGPRQGERFEVETPTHIVAEVTFASGAGAGLLVSFDVPASRQPGLEIMGTTATVYGPGASVFDGEITQARRLDGWETLPSGLAGWHDRLWAIGVLDTLDAMETGRQPRCSARFALHVQDVLLSIETAIASGDRVRPTTSVHRPPPLDAGDYGRLQERFL